MNPDFNIPVCHAQGKTLAEAFENALIELHDKGRRFKTQYDKPDDPESIDATMNITIEEPMSDPMIHKAFPGAPWDLREYVMELTGAKDHWVKNLNIDKDTRWEYTYHGRFKNWGQEKHFEYDYNSMQFIERLKGESQDQIEAVVQKLIEQPFTRQAQMITWMPNLDMDIYDPPCLQSWWGRIIEHEGVWYLNYNMRIRSNDAFSAHFMNVFGLTMMTKELIADKIAKRTGKIVKLGRMNWHADSFHIYGKDRKDFEERFWNRLDEPFEERVYNFYDSDIQEMYEEGTAMTERKIALQDANWEAEKEKREEEWKPLCFKCAKQDTCEYSNVNWACEGCMDFEAKT